MQQQGKFLLFSIARFSNWLTGLTVTRKIKIIQNLTTFPDGTTAVCWSFEKMPAGIKEQTPFGICIEHVGNLEAGNDAMSKAHRDTIIKVNALLCKKFKQQLLV